MGQRTGKMWHGRVQLTSLTKCRRVTATASARAVRESIVARWRSRGERGGRDNDELERSGRARDGWVPAAGREGRQARAEAARVSGERPSPEVLAERSGEARRARALLGGALARGLPRRSEPASYTGQRRRRVLQ